MIPTMVIWNLSNRANCLLYHICPLITLILGHNHSYTHVWTDALHLQAITLDGYMVLASAKSCCIVIVTLFDFKVPCLCQAYSLAAQQCDISIQLYCCLQDVEGAMQQRGYNNCELTNNDMQGNSSVW
jgi:hypothetical protein